MKALHFLLFAALIFLSPSLRAADGALEFSPASQQRVEVPNFAGLGISNEVTVEFWALSTSSSISQSVFILNPDATANRFQSQLNDSDGNTYWDFGDIASDGRVQVANNPAWLNNWTHFALVVSESGGFMKIYANGQEVAELAAFNALESVGTAMLSIGGISGSYFQGKIDEFRVWNTARTAEQIQSNLASSLNGQESGLRLYFKFDEPSGATAVNSATATGAAFNGTLVNSPARGTGAVSAHIVTTAVDEFDTPSGATVSLREALRDAAAVAGPSRITFAASLDGQTITLASEIELDMDNVGDVTVDATSLPAGLTLTGGGTKRLFSLRADTANFGSVTLVGLTLTGGNGTGAVDSGSGGAILNSAAALTLTRCILSGNTAENYGGAIYSFGALTLIESTLSGNSSLLGGAIYNSNPGTLTLARCTLSGNTASSTGGAIINDGSVTVIQSTFSGNSASVYGGAISNSLTLDVTQSTLAGNSANFEGGAIFNVGSVTLINSIVAGNTAPTGSDIRNLNAGVDPTTYVRQGANIIQSAANFGIVAETGPAASVADPLLKPLGNYGGPTQTRPPLAGSPAVNAASSSTVTTDQRGLPVMVIPDIGAAERQLTTFVDGTADTGDGTLRSAVLDAAALPGANTVTFDPALSGQTITAGSVIALSDPDPVTIDAANLAGGLKIDGNQGTRLFTVNTGASLTLKRLTLTRGNGSGGSGGAISSVGTLAAEDCTFSANAVNAFSAAGGAIQSGASSVLSLTRCTFTGNSANEGGGVRSSFAMLTATSCTFSGNSAVVGGALSITDGGPAATLTHCTIAGNTATGTFRSGFVRAGGGGVFAYLKDMTIRNCIVAGNTCPTSFGVDFGAVGGAFTSDGNVVGNNDTVSAIFPAGPVVGTTADPLDARLASLAGNGGITQTRSLLAGSPALDAGIATAVATDQRGLPRSRDCDASLGALPDAGAYEAQVAPVGSLGFNFNGSSPRNLAATESAGAPEFAQTHWNNLSGNSGNEFTTRTLAGGATADLQTWYEAPNTRVLSFGSPSNAQQKLMWGYLDSDGVANSGSDLSNPQNQPYFALASLPADLTLGGYKVVVYADSDATDGRVGEYWLTTPSGDPSNVTGTTELSPHLFLKDSANFSGSYTRVPATSTAYTTASSGNYLVFENQTQPGFIVRTEDSPGPRAVLNAVQVVRNEILVVTTATDELDPVGTLGTGLSLREALALAPDGAGIVFDSALSGATIALTAELGGEVVLAKDVTIDASNLPGGVTISGNSTSRIFTASSGRTIALLGLTLTGGNGVGASLSGHGGALLADQSGTVRLLRCTLTGNTTTGSPRDGGAIKNNGARVTLSQCTVAGNMASGAGGVAQNSGTAATLSLIHSTLARNTASSGGAIRSGSGHTLLLSQSIVAGNTATDDSAEDISLGGTLDRSGANVVAYLVNSSGTLTGTGTIIALDPLLAPLGNYSGSTQTMALMPGSPARNAATGSTATSDQRGFPIIGTPDIGAYEAGTATNYYAWIWESLPTAGNGLITDPLHAKTTDFDGDGQTNGSEWIARTDPSSSLSYHRVTQIELSGSNLSVTFPSVFGRIYQLQSSPDLSSPWTDLGPTTAGTGADLILSADVTGETRYFFRVIVRDP